MPRLFRKLAFDVAPMLVLAGAGLALARSPAAVPPGARAPAPLSLEAWKAILARTWKEFRQDQIPMIAAGVAFFTLLALFPGLGAFVALYGLFADVATAQHDLRLLAFMLPADALTLLGDQMIRLAAARKGELSLAFAASLLASLWSANGAVKAMITGLNIAYEVDERRNLLKLTALTLAFTFGFLVFVIAAIAVLAAGPVIATILGDPAAVAFGWVSWPILMGGFAASLAVLYRYGPSRPSPPWKWIARGAAAAVVLWIAVSIGFSLYVGNFGNYNETYGPLGAAVGFMIWLWLSSMVVLLGAELNSEIERQVAPQAPAPAPRPRTLR